MYNICAYVHTLFDRLVLSAIDCHAHVPVQGSCYQSEFIMLYRISLESI